MADITWLWVLWGNLGKFGNNPPPFMPAPISRTCVESRHLLLICPRIGHIIEFLPELAVSKYLQRGLGQTEFCRQYNTMWTRDTKQEKEGDLGRAAPGKTKAFGSFCWSNIGKKSLRERRLLLILCVWCILWEGKDCVWIWHERRKRNTMVWE